MENWFPCLSVAWPTADINLQHSANHSWRFWEHMIQKVHDDSSEWYDLGRTFSHVEGISVVAVQLALLQGQWCFSRFKQLKRMLRIIPSFSFSRILANAELSCFFLEYSMNCRNLNPKRARHVSNMFAKLRNCICIWYDTWYESSPPAWGQRCLDSDLDHLMMKFKRPWYGNLAVLSGSATPGICEDSLNGKTSKQTPENQHFPWIGRYLEQDLSKPGVS